MRNRMPALAAGLLAALAWQGAAAADAKPSAPHVFELAPGQAVVGSLQKLAARHEDTLPDIGRLFNLGYEEITAANPGVDPWLPGEGTEVLLPTRFILPDAPRDGLVLNVAALRLYYFPPVARGATPRVYTHPIGIGRVGWATPLGTTRVTAKVLKPTWYPPASVRKEHAEAGDPLPAVVPPGPDNPLGDHALRLALPSYLIHGTNRPWGVGMRVSHGCIRLYPEDIKALFDDVGPGTPVHIVEQPYMAAWDGGRLYFSAYPPLEETGGDWLAALELIGASVDDPPEGVRPREIDWARVARITREGRGIPFPIEVGTPAPRELVDAVPRVRAEPVANYRPAATREAAPEG